jgi:hypothetical protein
MDAALNIEGNFNVLQSHQVHQHQQSSCKCPQNLSLCKTMSLSIIQVCQQTDTSHHVIFFLLILSLSQKKTPHEYLESLLAHTLQFGYIDDPVVLETPLGDRS